MKKAEELRKQITEFAEKLSYGTHPPELYEPIRYLMALGGKRMRPLLVLLAYNLKKDEITEAILRPATGVEVFHNFTLMHDDIMDVAPLRRGKPTVHEKWNNNIAILSGDVMLVKAYEMFFGIDERLLPKILRKFSDCATKVCEGQQADMNFETRETVSEEEYLEMIRNKTAVLLGFSLELGGLLAGMEDNTAEYLRDFGINVGLGFQLKDDLLDVYGNQEKFGKQVGGDIVSNKKTFLLIKALESAGAEQRAILDKWLAATDFNKEEKVKAVTDIYNSLGIRDEVSAKIDEYFSKGFAALDALDIPEDRKKPLRDFTEYLINREM